MSKRNKALFVVIVALLSLVVVCCVFLFYGRKVERPIEGTSTGVTDNTITLGTSLALSGQTSFLGIEYLRGAQAYFSDVNKAGGIFDRKINIVSYDDMYTPAKTLINTQKLINENRVFALFNYVGTPTGIKAVPLINEASIPLVGLFTGATAFREPVNDNIFNIRASYSEETELFVAGAVDQLKHKKVAVFYQYDDYGFDGLRGVETALAKRNLKPVTTASYERGTLDVDKAFEQIKLSGADAVAMIGTYKPCAKFIKLGRANGYNPLFYSVSFVGSEALSTELGEAGNGVLVTEVVPPMNSTEPFVLEYKKSMAENFPNEKTSFGSLEGYLNARVISRAIELAGKDITRQDFTKSIESLSGSDIGLNERLVFNLEEHQGLHQVYPVYVENNEFTALSDWKAFDQKFNGWYK